MPENPDKESVSSKPEQINKLRNRRTGRIAKIAAGISLSMMTLLPSGCVYHRRGSNKFGWDFREAAVLFPGYIGDEPIKYGRSERLEDAFDREYEFAPLSSIAIWFAFPYEFLKALEAIDITGWVMSICPPVQYALKESIDGLRNKVKRAKDIRELQAEVRNKKE